MNQFDMSFIFNDVHIMNPTLSEDGRFSVSPAHYGFTIEQTGGGSTVWVKHTEKGVLVLGDNKGDCTHNLDDGFTMCLFDGSDSEGTFGKLLGIIDSEEMA
jgi:hypothetical protein